VRDFRWLIPAMPPCRDPDLAPDFERKMTMLRSRSRYRAAERRSRCHPAHTDRARCGASEMTVRDLSEAGDVACDRSFKERGALNKLLTSMRPNAPPGRCDVGRQSCSGVAFHARRLGIRDDRDARGTPFTRSIAPRRSAQPSSCGRWLVAARQAADELAWSTVLRWSTL